MIIKFIIRFFVYFFFFLYFSALFSSSFSTDDESESEGSIVSPCSPETYVVPKGDVSPVKYRRKGHAANLLGW